MALLIVYEHADFKGKSKRITRNEPMLGDFGKMISSFKIVEGKWEFYTDAQYYHRTGGGSFSTGDYPWVGKVGIANDAITSVKLVG